MAQACHALRQFTHEHPDLDRCWFEISNRLVILSVPDQPSLRRLRWRAQQQRVCEAAFHEPDLGGALTAIALEPGRLARRLCRGLPLGLSLPRPRDGAPVPEITPP